MKAMCFTRLGTPLALCLAGWATGAAAAAAATNALPLRQLMSTPLRDPSICRGPDGTWYLTGTVPPFWSYNEGIKVWRSKDFTNWVPLGFVWKYGRSPWHAKYLEAKKPLWAPEIHFLRKTFWLTYSLPGWDGTGRTSGCGLLKSTTGRAEGPYADVQPGERLGGEIDASRHHSGLCAGIFGTNSFDHVGFEGMFVFKANGRYYLDCSDECNGRYSCFIATATNLYGPYGERYEAIPHGGHNMFFCDEKGHWWSTFFGSDAGAPWRERPGLLPVVFDSQGKVRPQYSTHPPGIPQ